MTLSFPSSPINGAVSGDYTFDASKGAWRKNAALPVSVTHSDVAPSNPREGDQWWKSNEGTLFTYYNDGDSSQWVESTNVVANVEPNPIPAGAMMAWASDIIPANWLLCDGTAVSRSTYASLFAAIGTTYGGGDGTTTFNLPNLKGKTIVGKDSTQTEFDLLGETGGAKTHTLTASEMPSHTHTFSATTSSDGAHTHKFGYETGSATASGQPYANTRAMGHNPANQYSDTSSNGAHTHTISGTTGSAGSGGAHNNLQPYIVLNYIIKFSAGETPGDSQLAVRVGTLETQNNATPQSQNYLLNGGFDFWQRGTSYTSTQYGPDRWWLPISGGTISQETTDLPTGFKYGVKYVSSGASQFGQFNQALESDVVYQLRGQTVTVSGYVKIAGSFTGNWVSQALYSTSTDAYASQTTLVTGSSKVVATSSTSAWTRFSNTFTVPSNAVGLRIENIPDTVQPSGVTIRMTGIQLEIGNYATPFRRNSPSMQAELAACQRFFIRMDSSQNANLFYGTGSMYQTTLGVAVVPLPVTLRKLPSVTTSAANTFQLLTTGANIALSAISAPTAHHSYTSVGFDVTSPNTIGNGAGFTFRSNATTSSWINIDAEL